MILQRLVTSVKDYHKQTRIAGNCCTGFFVNIVSLIHTKKSCL
jgi:hypothetical protein